MKVTDLQYALENRLLKKLDLMIERCTTDQPKRDAVLINEGGEGEGKSNTSVAEAYYIKSKTNRPIYLFFRLHALVEFAKTTKEQIIIWDEPSLDSLAQEHYKEINIQLMKLLMTCRKNRHFFIINMTKFWKFNEYVVVDRCLGMVHMYSRREIEIGRFVYINKRSLEPLFIGYKRTKKRLYKKYTKFRGSFPNIMEKYFDRMGITMVGIDGKFYPNATYDIYEREKDKAIVSIGTKDTKDNDNPYKKEVKELKGMISKLKPPIKTTIELVKQLHISSDTFYTWKKNEQKAEEKPTGEV
jgi:hypothetical protein